MPAIFYHNVIDSAPDAFDRRLGRIPVARFRSQMERLAQRFDLVDALDYADAACAGRSAAGTRPMATVTFDDACAGVWDHAEPILRALGIPGTVFAVTSHCNAFRPFHFDELEIAFRLTRRTRIESAELPLPDAEIGSIEARVDYLKRMKRVLKAVPNSTRLRFHQLLLSELRVSSEECLEFAQANRKYEMLNWVGLRKIRERGWCVGSHTVSHPVLAQLPATQLEGELRISFAEVRRELGPRPVALAYPYGATEHIGPLAPSVAEAAGYQCAYTTIPADHGGLENRFLLGRVSG